LEALCSTQHYIELAITITVSAAVGCSV